VRNSLLAKEFCAVNTRGSSLIPKTRVPRRKPRGGRRAFPLLRSGTVRFRGALGSENVGMSNCNAGEIPAHRKPKVSATMVISRGLGGPKVKPKGAADGHSVNIPILPFFAARATKFSNLSGLLDSRGQPDCPKRKRGPKGLSKCFGSPEQIQTSKLPRKTSQGLSKKGNRTVNRHRW